MSGDWCHTCNAKNMSGNSGTWSDLDIQTDMNALPLLGDTIDTIHKILKKI